ncbi:hypothetical protein GCM10022200_30860 [Microbacterium awajiense]|uniref:Uncharacterized protein n=1 Tax=Microbacterium awajiense TaxID=415214 RepID=A0ABP7B150_9MICO
MSSQTRGSGRLAELTALSVLTWVALLLGLGLGIWTLVLELTDPGGNPLLQAALAWWASLMVIIGTIAGVGMIVLSGVRSMLSRR